MNATKNGTISGGYKFGPFRVDLTRRLLLRDGEPVVLRPKAFDTLLALVEEHGRVLDKDELMRRVWPDTVVEENNLAQHLSALRKVLGESPGAHQYIVTIPGRGYRFVAAVREAEGSEESAAGGGPAVPRQPYRRLGPALIAAVLAAGAVGLALWLTARRPSPAAASPATFNLVPFTTFPGDEVQPVFSPDGEQVAFAARGEGEANFDLYVKQVGAEGMHRLTTDPADDTDPAWSPDGRYLAFLRRSEGRFGVFIIPALGGAERKIGEAAPRWKAWTPDISWSPDGTSLAIADRVAPDEASRIYLLAIETGEKRPLTSPPAGGGDFYPAFSPDGKTLAFVRSDSNAINNVYLAPAAGGAARRLTADGAMVHGVAWSPDSREVIFMSTRANGYNYKLWRVPAAGGTPEQIVAAGGGVIGFAVASRGDRLMYSHHLGDSNIWQMELGKTARRRPPVRLIASTLYDASPHFSPDGERVAFASVRSGAYEIWVCDRDGANSVQLTRFGGPLSGSPRWSPDGRQIVFDGRAEGNAEIYVINADGGQLRRLTTDPAADVVPSWSRDGKWIYYCSNRSGSLQIWKMPAEGGTPIQVTREGGFESEESTDGRYLYYSKERDAPGLWRIPTAGGREEFVLDQHQAGWWRYWTVTGRGIYFATAERPSRPLLEFFDFASGKFQTVGTFDRMIMTGLSGLTVSPDGRRLLYTQIDQSGSDLMLVEGFR